VRGGSGLVGDGNGADGGGDLDRGGGILGLGLRGAVGHVVWAVKDRLGLGRRHGAGGPLVVRDDGLGVLPALVGPMPLVVLVIVAVVDEDALVGRVPDGELVLARALVLGGAELGEVLALGLADAGGEAERRLLVERGRVDGVDLSIAALDGGVGGDLTTGDGGIGLLGVGDGGKAEESDCGEPHFVSLCCIRIIWR